MNRPSLYAVDIWAQWEAGILEILEEALSQLDECLKKEYARDEYTENNITTVLHKLMRDIRFYEYKKICGIIQPQAQNEPINALGKQENLARLRKRPDLQWKFYDENADTPEKSQRSFTIECKCLSTTTEEKNYVENGISRFVLAEWGYGEGEKSAAMIGYIKGGTVDKHFSQINKHNEQYNYPLLGSYPNKEQDVYRYEQKFEAREFEPQNFVLHHLWTDISNA